MTNDTRSKQFIKIIKQSNGQCESMIQRVYRQIRRVDPECSILIAASKSQVSELRNQLGDEIDLVLEPCRRGTFMAIAQAAAYLRDEKGIDENEAIVVCPSDTFAEDQFYDCLDNMYATAKSGETKLAIVGIESTYPSEKYGYIIPKTDDNKHYYFGFIEKPDKKMAEQCIALGGLWNSGVFAFQLKYVLEKARALLGTDSYAKLHSAYAQWEERSFDRAVAEQEREIEVLRYLDYWKDIGTWNTLTETMSDAVFGKGMIDETSTQTHIVNELDIPILAMGLKTS